MTLCNCGFFDAIAQNIIENYPGLQATHAILLPELLCARQKLKLLMQEADIEAAICALLGGQLSIDENKDIWQAIIDLCQDLQRFVANIDL